MAMELEQVHDNHNPLLHKYKRLAISYITDRDNHILCREGLEGSVSRIVSQITCLQNVRDLRAQT